ncbi:AT-rich interactive domain-containing protein 2 [Vitis vinifera]|uniref:AT-rich interactive domain-containing protein 2 n=1 Tax=Vitis vinifera TaxID=29760 RepID=A0A438D4L6_VITVI|nr:AT-rich interactive domain-containing protein 2 [Vitis vinifera]
MFSDLQSKWYTSVLFGDEETSNVACKHSRQLEHTNHLVSSAGVVPCNIAPQRTQLSMEKVRTVLVSLKMKGEMQLTCTIEEDKSEAAFHLSFFPEYFEADHGVRAVIQHEDIFSSLLDHPPQKLVSIGPEHQALIPEWAPQLLENSLDYSDTSGFMNGGKEEELMGTIVIPMPDWEPLAYNFCKGGGIGNECNCLHVGSISCTRQHVMEARQRLRENLGQDMFEKLGFCDMGEEVADKWSEDEEHAFDEVVLSYPASLDKNFWDHLSGIFPSRTKKDLVSYYFNVFMLRKRAEQNSLTH